MTAAATGPGWGDRAVRCGLRLRLGVRAGLVGVSFTGLLDPLELGLQPGEGVVALGLVVVGLFGVVADDEADVGVVEADLLDLLVAALPRQHPLD